MVLGVEFVEQTTVAYGLGIAVLDFERAVFELLEPESAVL